MKTQQEVVRMTGYEAEAAGSGWWWIFPLVMIALCFFAMRGRKGSMICGLGSRKADSHSLSNSDSALEILDKRYALGEIDTDEYEEKKRTLSQGK